MTNSAYQQWWQLHIRAARGESLTAEEQKLYGAGIDELDREEADQLQLAPLANLRRLRNQMQLLTQSLVQLAERSEQLNHQIATLEQAYQQLTGYPLMLDAYATSS